MLHALEWGTRQHPSQQHRARPDRGHRAGETADQSRRPRQRSSNRPLRRVGSVDDIGQTAVFLAAIIPQR